MGETNAGLAANCAEIVLTDRQTDRQTDKFFDTIYEGNAIFSFS